MGVEAGSDAVGARVLLAQPPIVVQREPCTNFGSKLMARVNGRGNHGCGWSRECVSVWEFVETDDASSSLRRTAEGASVLYPLGPTRMRGKPRRARRRVTHPPGRADFFLWIAPAIVAASFLFGYFRIQIGSMWPEALSGPGTGLVGSTGCLLKPMCKGRSISPRQCNPATRG